MTSISGDNEESYPGRDLSIFQLSYAMKKKLQGVTLGRRYAWTVFIALVVARA
jgi:hypothetical protein